MNKESQILQVPIEDIIPNRFQPRLSFDDSSLQELSNSIKQHGIIQPLVLRKVGEKYEIIAGERRYKASMMAGLTSVPAIITELDDKKSAEIAIVENIQRKDLSAIEEAKSYKSLLDKGYLTQEELAKKMGISQSAISNKLRLLTLSNEVQEALMEGKISERHARSLLQLNNPNDQIKWLNKIINERLTVKDLENRLKKKTDVPIININPNMEDIINNSTDIIAPTVSANITQNVESTQKPMANKFFNALEDEVVNMRAVEPDLVIEQPEEIEMLDMDEFMPVSPISQPVTEPMPVNSQEAPKEYIPESNLNKELIQAALDDIDDLMKDFKNSYLAVDYHKVELPDEYQITINIKKDLK